MTQQKAILAHTSSVAFLIPVCLSFAGAVNDSGPDSFVIRRHGDFWTKAGKHTNHRCHPEVERER